VAHAQSLSAGTLAVDVNEQNEAALRFYMMLGFSVGARYHWMQAVGHSLFCT
jgi:ribosomal protein S18 acetylase RimI-like enzyme